MLLLHFSGLIPIFLNFTDWSPLVHFCAAQIWSSSESASLMNVSVTFALHAGVNYRNYVRTLWHHVPLPQLFVNVRWVNRETKTFSCCIIKNIRFHWIGAKSSKDFFPPSRNSAGLEWSTIPFNIVIIMWLPLKVLNVSANELTLLVIWVTLSHDVANFPGAVVMFLCY